MGVVDEAAALELEALEPPLLEVCTAVVIDEVRIVAVPLLLLPLEAPEVGRPDWPDEVAVALLPPLPPPVAGWVRSMVVVSWLTSVGRVTSIATLATSLVTAELYIVLEKPHTDRISSISRGRAHVSD